jgi:predicted esterase
MTTSIAPLESSPSTSPAPPARGVMPPIAPNTLGAISSGGYMTSRMAVSYPGKFRALAIESGSYATCSNVLCMVPNPLPADHPPTLFLHGALDVAVPLVTARAYHDQLARQGIETEIIVDDTVGHSWLAVAPEAITCWFKTH